MTEQLNKKLLIIEDDDMLANLLSNHCVSQGFTVDIARDGEEGMKKISEMNPDAIIIDIVMPKKDGISVLKELHSKEPNSTRPIIVLSNSSDINHVATAVANKAAAYLVKSDQRLQSIVDTVKQKLGII